MLEPLGQMQVLKHCNIVVDDMSIVLLSRFLECLLCIAALLAIVFNHHLELIDWF